MGAAVTVTVVAGEVDALWSASPEYDAAIMCVPAPNLLVVNCAEPAAKATEPICDCASRNETIPVGVLEPD